MVLNASSMHKAILKSVPLFRTLGNADLQNLAESLVRIQFEASDVVITEGEAGDVMFVVQSGHLVASTELKGVVKEYTGGTFFGELALVNDAPRKATVTATRDSVLLQLRKADVDRLPLSNTFDYAAPMPETQQEKLEPQPESNLEHQQTGLQTSVLPSPHGSTTAL
eukprot:COSAG02_NODE_1772_length_10984_cov_8.166651_8_plen_167_part_00